MTGKQKLFVKSYIISKNATQAAKDAGYSAKTATVEGSRLLRHAEIQEAIDREFAKIIDRYDFTENDVKAGIYKVIGAKDCKASDRLRGWELLGKALGLFRDNQVQVNLFQGLDADKLQKARSMLKARGLQRKLSDAVTLPDGKKAGSSTLSVDKKPPGAVS